MNTPTHGQNDTRFDDFMSDVRQFGRNAAEGKDALPMLAARVVAAANDGVIDLDKDKHGDGVDDAAFLYAEYSKSEAKKSVHEMTDGGKKANVSKLRQIIKFGGMTTCDPVDVFNRTVIKRKKMVAADQKVKPAYASYVDVARAQLDLDRDMSDDEIAATITRKGPEPKDLEKILRPIEKALEGVISGENKHGVKDQSPEVITAFEQIRSRLAALIAVRETGEAIKTLQKHGIAVVEDAEEQPETEGYERTETVEPTETIEADGDTGEQATA